MIPKFRAWDKVSETMHKVEGIRFGINGARVISLAEMNRYNNNHKRWHTDVELFQSTGLKDAHGTEIYEKDIVRDSYGDVFLIEWLDGSFVLTDFFSGGYDHCSIDDSEAYEIIGNQFEHPHLLKE